MDMHVRLFEERERLGFSQEEMAAAGGMKKRAYCYYESGERVPDAAFLEQVASHGVDVYYVLTGQRVATATTLTAREAALVDNYRASDEDAKKALEKTSAALAQSAEVMKKAG
jgi:transcriptional regulator with XRE-family HTH domain